MRERDGALVLIHRCAPRALVLVRSRVFMLYRGNNRIRAYSVKNRAVFGLGSSFGEPQGISYRVLPVRPAHSHERRLRIHPRWTHPTSRVLLLPA